MRKTNMNSKTKILIVILVAGVVLIGGFLYSYLFLDCIGEMQEIKPGQHCCFGLKTQRISIPVINNKPQLYCIPPEMEESIKKGNSILRLKKLCLLNDGRKFNAECENKEVILNNLWLYPVKEKEKLTEGFYLYSSDTFSGVSPIAVSGEVSLMEGSFITVYTEDNQDLFEEIKNKTEAIEKPIPVTIKGVIKPSELCTQNAPCRYGLFIVVQNISYESATKTDREVTITTDKTEYKQGEDIKITLENNLNESIYSYGLFQFGCGALYLQKEDLSGDWKDVDTFICPVPMLPPVIEYKAGKKKSYYFNQKIDYEEKVLAKPGRYRFEFIYYIECEPQDSDRSLFICPSENKKTIYSNEFIIKEKSKNALLTTEAAIKKANELGYKSILRPPTADLVKDHPKSPLIVYYQKKREQKYLYEALGLNPLKGIVRLWLVYYFIGPEDGNIVVVLDFQSGEILGVLENVTIGRPEKY